MLSQGRVLNGGIISPTETTPTGNFILSLPAATTVKEKKYKSVQEGVRKCVELVFGVLFRRFCVLAQPSRLWFSSEMRSILQACVVLHNMLVEYRNDSFTMDGIGKALLWDLD